MRKEIKKVPTIRFRGFTEDWEQRKLGEVLDLLKDGTHGTHQNAKKGPWLLSAKNIKNGKIVWDESDRKISKEEYNSIHSNFQLQANDVLLTIVGSIGETAILRNPQGLTFQRSVAFLRPNKNVDPEFMYSEIQGNQFQYELEKRKSTSAQPGVYLGDLKVIPFCFPINMREQKEIATYFKNLNNLITLHQRKFDELKTAKKFFLQNMFPAKGEKVPRIRFHGFTGDWEQRKLSELVTIERGGSPRPINKFITKDPNGLNWVKIGDAPEQGNYITHTAEKIRPEGLSKTREVHPGDLILSNSMSFGKPYIMAIDGCIHDGWLVIRESKKHFNLKFLCTLLGTENMLNQYKAMAAGSTVNNLNKELVGNTKVSYPSKIEQKVIGEYFSNLDNLITLHQRKLDQLKTLKKFMLQNLFI